MEENNNLTQLHTALVNKGAVTGSVDDFKTYLSDDKNRNDLFEALKNKGAVTGSFNDFTSWLGMGENTTAAAQPTSTKYQLPTFQPYQRELDDSPASILSPTQLKIARGEIGEGDTYTLQPGEDIEAFTPLPNFTLEQTEEERQQRQQQPKPQRQTMRDGGRMLGHNAALTRLAQDNGIATEGFENLNELGEDAMKIYALTPQGKADKQNMDNAAELAYDDFAADYLKNGSDQDIKAQLELGRQKQLLEQENAALAKDIEAWNAHPGTEQQRNALNARIKDLNKRLGEYEEAVAQDKAQEKVNEAFQKWLENDDYYKAVAKQYEQNYEATMGEWFDGAATPLYMQMTKDEIAKMKAYLDDESLNLDYRQRTAIKRRVRDAEAWVKAAEKNGWLDKTFAGMQGKGAGIDIATMFRGMGHAIDFDLLDFGIGEAIDDATLRRISEKVRDKGEASLTPEERAVLLSDEALGLTKSVFNVDESAWNAGANTAEMLPFIVELWLSGGANAAIKAGVKGAVKGGAKGFRQGLKAGWKAAMKPTASQLGRLGDAARFAPKSVGQVAKEVGMTAAEIVDNGLFYALTTGSGHTISQLNQYMTPELDADFDFGTGKWDIKGVAVDEQGNIKGGDKFGIAALKAIGMQAIEGGSEMLGEKALQPLLDRGGYWLRGMMGKQGRAMYKPYLRVVDDWIGHGVLKNVSGFGTEYAEELAGSVARVITGLSTWDQEFNKQNLADTAYGLMPAQVAFAVLGGGRMVGHARRSSQAKDLLDKYAPEQAAFYDRVAQMSTYDGADMLDRKTLEILKTIDEKKNNGTLTEEDQRKAAAELGMIFTMQEQIYMDEASAYMKDKQGRRMYEGITSNLNKDNGMFTVYEWKHDGTTERVPVLSTKDGKATVRLWNGKKQTVDLKDLSFVGEYTPEQAMEFSQRRDEEFKDYAYRDQTTPMAGSVYYDAEGNIPIVPGKGEVNITEVADNGEVTFTTEDGTTQTMNERQFYDYMRALRDAYEVTAGQLAAWRVEADTKGKTAAENDDPQAHYGVGREARMARRALANAIGEERMERLERMDGEQLTREYMMADEKTQDLMYDWMQNRVGDSYGEAMNQRRQQAITDFKEKIGITDNDNIGIATYEGNTVAVENDNGDSATVIDMMGNKTMVPSSSLTDKQTTTVDAFATQATRPQQMQIDALEQAYNGTTFQKGQEYTIGTDVNGEERKAIIVSVNEDGTISYATEYGYDKEGNPTPAARSVKVATEEGFRDMTENARQQRATQEQGQREAAQQRADMGELRNGQRVTIMDGGHPVQGTINMPYTGSQSVFTDTQKLIKFDTIDDLKKSMQDAANALQAEQQAAIEAVANRINELANAMPNASIKVVTDINELRPDARELARKGQLEAYFDPDTNTVMFYAPGLVANNSNVDGKVIHEVIIHYGLRNMLGKKDYAALCFNIFNNVMDDNDRAQYVQYVKDSHPDWQKTMTNAQIMVLAADEWLAFTYENRDIDSIKRESLLQTIVNFIVDLFKKAGVDLNRDEVMAELDQLVAASRDWLRGEEVKKEKKTYTFPDGTSISQGDQIEVETKEGKYVGKVDWVNDGYTNNKHIYRIHVVFEDGKHTDKYMEFEDERKKKEEKKEPVTFTGYHTPTIQGKEKQSIMTSAGLPKGYYIALDKPYEDSNHDASQARKVSVKVGKVYDPDGILGEASESLGDELAGEISVQSQDPLAILEALSEHFTKVLQQHGYDAYVRNIDGQEGNRELIVLDPSLVKEEKTREELIANAVQAAANFAAQGDHNFVKDNLDKAKKRVSNAKKRKPTSTDPAKRQEQIEKINTELAAAENELAFWNDVQAVINEAQLAGQTRLNEADQALQDLDKNLVPTVEAEEVHKFDKEPANADEAAADFLVGFVKKEHRINEESLMKETNWSEDEAKNFRPATTPDGGMTLQEAAENLYNEYESEGSEHGWFKDPSEARDKLVSVMQEAGKYGELANYINQRRGNDEATQQMQAALDANAQQLGYEDAQDMHDKRMAEAKAKLEELKDEQGNLSDEALQQFKDFTQGLMIGQEETPAEQPTESIEGGEEFFQPSNEEAPFSVVLPIDQQTPKNTTIDQVLYSIKVNHNSPYLLKKADGSFIDPETGERLGFDHRFMSTGEGAQAHGWGSYFSVEDLPQYAESDNVYYDEDFDDRLNQERLRIDESIIREFKIPTSEEGVPVVRREEQYVFDSDDYDKVVEAARNFYGLFVQDMPDRELVWKLLRDMNQTFQDAEDEWIDNQKSRHHYDVEIPDNDGTNYFEENETLKPEQVAMLQKQSDKEGAKAEVGGFLFYANPEKNPYADKYTFRKFLSDITSNMGGGLTEQQASEFFHRAGFVGIHYDGQRDGECYVIFDENDAKIVDHVMFSITGLITNEQGEIDYDRVTNLAKSNEWQGLSRLPQAYRQSSVPAAAATIISKAVPVEDRSGSEASRQRGDVQGVRQGDRGNNNQGRPDQGGNGASLGNLADTIKSDIEAWAKSQGYWYDEARLTDGFTEIEGGTESRVFVNADKTKARKLTSYPPAYGEYMQLLMENIGIFNATFPDAAYEVIGFGKDKNGNLAAVVEQPYIEGRQAKDRTEVVEAMRAFGFRPFYDEVTFTNGRVFASDVNEKNMVIDTEGKPHVIDAVMSLRSDLYNDSNVLYSVVTPQQDADYMDAVSRGDMETAQRMVNEAAREAGYTANDDYKDSHRAPAASVDRKDFTDLEALREVVENDSADSNLFAIAQGVSTQPDDYFSRNGARWYGYDDEEGLESYSNLKQAMDEINRQMEEYGEVRDMPTIKVYRAVPSEIKGGQFESGGQWVTPSRLYAKDHGQHRFGYGKYRIVEQEVRADELWWDGNDINEWGFDDDKEYAYQNTKNNRKLLDPVTYDDEGNVIPLSKRFNKRSSDIRYSVVNRNQAIFVSNAARSVDGIKQEKATPEQWLKMIEKNGGLKAGEDKWIGLSQWLKDSDAKTLTKQEVLDFINENAIKIEEVEYGGEDAIFTPNSIKNLESELQRGGYNPNNVENTEWILDEWDKAFNDSKLFEYQNGYFDIDENGKIILLDKAKIGGEINSTRLLYTTKGLDNKREIALTVPTIEPWNEGDDIHFGDAGEGRAVAWIRFGETTDADGKRVLVIDEIQSKRHQEGREKGYADDKDVKAYNDWMNSKAKEFGVERYQVESRLSDEEYAEMVRLQDAARGTNQADKIPAAPFEKNWMELAMKRMLRLAAEEGYDKVAWTTGEQQAERYDIGNVVDNLYIDQRPDEDRFVDVRDGDGSVFTALFDASGKVTAATREDFAGGVTLADYFGNDLADKILKSENGDIIKGDGLRIGGEGMKGFYDKMIPSFMNKYGKQWGVKVGEVTMPNLEEGYQTMHSIDVNEQMKADVMEGQVMFSVKNSQNNADDKQLSLFLQNNTGEYETQDGQTIGFTSLLDGDNSSIDSGARPGGVQRENGATNPTDYHLRKLEPGETCHVERRYVETQGFDFTGSERIETTDDVAYIFKQLENAAIENSFVVLIKDGTPTVIHTGIGTYDQTIVNLNNAMVAYQKLNPDKVYFVHNHPSGNIVASNPDKRVYANAKKLFGDKLQPSIIIDTTSGLYGTFTDTTEDMDNVMPKEVKNETPIKTYSFSKQVFEEDWKPSKVYPIKSSNDVATFVSSHRLGEHKKMSLLILTPQHNVIGNIFLPYTSLSETPQGIDFANEVGYYINQMGGVTAILYGNFRFDSATIDKIQELKDGLKIQGLNLTDCIHISPTGDRYKSAIEARLLSENEAEYGRLTDEQIHEILSKENADTTGDPVLYSVSQAANTPQERLRLYDAMVGTKEVSKFVGRVTEGFYQSVVDGAIPLKRLQDVIAGRGKVTDAENAYLMEIARAARAKRLTDEAETKYYEPMMKAIAALTGRTSKKGYYKAMRDVELYVLAKSGLERNQWFWDEAKKSDPNAQLEDKSGLTALAAEFGEKDFTAFAERLVADYEARHGQQKIDELWKCINAVSKNILDTELDGHLISQELHDDLLNRWKFYVPMRGFDEQVTSAFYAYQPSSATIRFENPFKKIKGRVSLADNPFVNLIRMTESAINLKGKNEVGLALLNLAASHEDNGLLRVGKAWEVKEVDPATGEVTWKAAYPNLSNVSQADIPAAIDAFQKSMMRQAKTGDARPSSRTAGGVRIHPSDIDQHVLKVKVGGQTVDLYLLGNPKAFQALNPTGKSKAGEKLSGLTRSLSGLMTTYNPVFMVRNSIRDFKTAAIITYTRDGAAGMFNMMGQWFGNMNALRKLIKGESSGDATIDRYWQEFLEFGGETGFTRSLNMEKQREDFNKKMFNLTRDKSGQAMHKITHWYFDWMEKRGNRYAEDITRFAVFCASRKQGRSAMQSAADAKNTTANFNKKGQSGFARFMSTNFAFFNAAIQGLNTSFHAFKDNPGRAATAAVSTMIYSMAIPFVNMCLLAMFGDDDDWRQYENMTQFVSNTHAVYYIPGAGFLTMPYPQDFVPFTSLGNIIWRNAAGFEKPLNGRSIFGNVMLQWFDTWADLLPVNAFEEGFGEMKDWKGVARALAPTWLSPVADVMLNRNFMGSQIRRKHFLLNDQKDLAPYWAEYDRSKNWWAHDIAKLIAGGDEYRAGAAWRNVDPRQLIHLVEGYGGGTVKLVSDIAVYFVEMAKGDKPTLNQAPFIKKFWIQPNPDKYEGNLNGKLYEMAKYQRELEQQIKDLQKEADKAHEDGNDKAAEKRENKIEEIRNSKEYKILTDYDVNGMMKDWRDERNGITNDETLSEEGKQDKIVTLTYRKAAFLDGIWEELFLGEEAPKQNWFSDFYRDASTEAYTHNRKEGE